MAYGGTSAGTSGKYSQITVQGSGKIRKFGDLLWRGKERICLAQND